ncbi:RNA polymerase sigma-70 factor [Bacteroides sp. UBA939]|uniref:RNA polymerase sigma-70 factor n=1 Tax=Bacteroides sp. UBA939 TaxID=1946092 RepID=UPI0025BB737E|nr:RNA polymerase sigma-70 factor [Bacteroides sp. UBA939]
MAELKNGDKEAFSLLFKKYYRDLVLFGGTLLPDRSLCEDIVQNIFTQLWEDRNTLNIGTSLKSYLLRSVQNACIDEIRHSQSVREYEKYMNTYGNYGSMNTGDYILYSDLHDNLENALNKLPKECKLVFVMSRLNGMKYKEIAQQLEVSERTVEVRIGKAIGLLKLYLKDFLPLILALLYT